jgi:hypothetical protein
LGTTFLGEAEVLGTVLLELCLVAVLEGHSLHGAVSTLPARFTSTLAIGLAGALTRAVVHKLTTFVDNRAAITIVASEFLILDVISEELEGRLIIVSRDEMT